MTNHDRLMSAAGSEALLVQHGEPVVYRPAGGRPRPIRAIVVRQPAAPIADSRGPVTPRVMIRALNHSLKGIASREVNTGGDKIDVAWILGGPVTSRSICQPITTAGGFTVCELQ